MTDIVGQHLERGTLVSRYEIREELGAGGFGVTYKAFDTQLHCEVAIKEYLPAEFAVRSSDHTTVAPRNIETAELYEYGLNQFLDEARVLAKFKNRHIVRVSDFMKVNGTAYLVMDYEEGQPLGELLKQRGGSLAETEIKNIFIPILDGLKTVHDTSLLHRDIKPDNIYLRSDGPPVLLDFGAARQYTANQTRSVTAIVTPGYAPFEQYQPHGELGAWTDLYAVGATLYHCISGKPPIDVLTRHGVRVDPLPPAVEVGVDRYSEVLLQTVDWMLRQQPDQRPRSVDEVLPCIQGRATPPAPQPTVEPQSRAQPDAPTVRVTSPGTVPAAATIRRSRSGPRRGDMPLARLGGNHRIGLMAGAAVVMLIGAGAIWWYVEDQNQKQLVIQEQREAIKRMQLETARERLRNAEAALAAGRFATPQNDNALAHFRMALQLDPASQEAQKGIDKVFNALLSRSEQAADIADFRRANDYLDSAAEIYPGNADVQSARKMIASREAARLTQVEAEKKAAEGAARKAQAEAVRVEQAEAEQKAAEEAERLTQLEVERKAAEEAARLARAGTEPVSSGPLAIASNGSQTEIATSQQVGESEDKTNKVTGNVDEFNAWFKAVATRYVGEISNPIRDHPDKVITEFFFRNGTPSGLYTIIEPNRTTKGKLTVFQSKGERKGVFRWVDKYGKGSLQIKFDTSFGEFSALWIPDDDTNISGTWTGRINRKAKTR